MSTGTGARVVGLTGGLGSGKSTVGRLLRARGAEVIDADEVARAVVEPGRPAYEQLVAAFGPGILQGGEPGGPAPAAPAPIDRAKLAARVFPDPEARALLNRITHPAIAAESARRIAAFGARGVPVVVYEATLIAENRLYDALAGVIVVDVPEETQIERAVRRGGLTPDEARARMRAQASRADRLAIANWVVDNRADLAALERQVDAVWADIGAQIVPPRGGTKVS